MVKRGARVGAQTEGGKTWENGEMALKGLRRAFRLVSAAESELELKRSASEMLTRRLGGEQDDEGKDPDTVHIDKHIIQVGLRLWTNIRVLQAETGIVPIPQI